jgi:hypothetical protein
MKQIIAFIIFFILISNLHAQSNTFKDSLFSSWQNNRYFFNHAEQLKQKNNQINPKTFMVQKTTPANPSVLKLPAPELTFVRNYNHSNIYQATPDNMFIIKPDNSLIFNMPVANNN